MSLITPYLYIGDINDANNLQLLKSKNIRVIVNCTREVENFYPNHFEYQKLNLNDDVNQSLYGVLDPISEYIINSIRSGKVVFVHCYAGISRSASIVIYTLMKLHNWKFDKSLRYVRSIRPQIEPNAGFTQQLVGDKPQQYPENIESTSIEDFEPESQIKEWTKLTFDSEEGETPEYIKSRGKNRRSYAKIFT